MSDAEHKKADTAKAPPDDSGGDRLPEYVPGDSVVRTMRRNTIFLIYCLFMTMFIILMFILP